MAKRAEAIREYTQEITSKEVLNRLPELFEPQAIYTPEQKVQAAAVWLMTGEAKQAAEAIGAPPATVRDWTTRKAWWPVAIELARKLLESKLDHTLDRLLRRDLAELEDRLEHGDEVISKDGTPVRKKVGAKDCAVIADILYNKRAALRGQPGNITEKRDATTLLDLIRRESGKHGAAKLVEIDPATVLPENVHGEVLSDEGNMGAGADWVQDVGPQNGPVHLNAENM